MAIITISRGAMTGGEKLAKHLAEKLGYQAVNREIIIECSKKYNIIEQDLLDELEKLPSLWHRLTKERNRDLIFIKCSLIDAVRHDNIIYYGHAGPLLLSDFDNVLRLRLEAPLEDRISVVMKELNKDHKGALEYIKETDDQRQRWVKLLYEENWRDPSLYDLTFNLKNISIDTVCDMISLAIGQGAFKITEESVKQLGDISLACEVKAAIASDDRIWDQPITVNAYNGIIIVRGNVKSAKLKDLISDTARQVKGVIDCDLQIGLSTISSPKGHE